MMSSVDASKDENTAPMSGLPFKSGGSLKGMSHDSLKKADSADRSRTPILSLFIWLPLGLFFWVTLSLFSFVMTLIKKISGEKPEYHADMSSRKKLN